MQARALSIQGLTKTYRNGLTALKSIHLEVEDGDFFALLGPNGAGKSTAIGIVSSLVNKTAGRVAVFGNDLDREPAAVRSLIGLVPQEFNFNIWEPVIEIVVNQAGYYGIARHLAYRRAEQYLTELGLWEKRRVMACELSGGMKRRLMIARALVHRPKLLILDEPTAGVDIELRRSMWAFLRRTNAEGTTIILTTHYLEEAEHLCRNIAIIDRGDIIENTSMKALLGRLNMETFVLYLDQPLREIPKIPGRHAALADETTLEVEIAKEQSINNVFAALSAQGIEVLSMRNKVNRLEELFLRLLGENGGNAASMSRSVGAA